MELDQTKNDASTLKQKKQTHIAKAKISNLNRLKLAIQALKK